MKYGPTKASRQTWLEVRVIKMYKALDFAFYPGLVLGQRCLPKILERSLWVSER